MTGYLVFTVRFLLCVVLLVSTGSKLRDFPAFVAWVRGLPVLPERRARGVAVAMTAAEAVAMVLLLVPTFVAGLSLAAVLLAFFAAAAAFLVRRGVAVPCRCFGAGRAPLGVADVVRNTLLTAVATAAAVITVLAPRPVPPVPAIVMAALVGGALGLVVTRLDDVWRLFAR